MPRPASGGPTVNEAQAAVARLTGIPLDDLKGFVLLAVDMNDEPTVLTSAATYRTVVSVLLDTAHEMVLQYQLDDPTNG